MCEARLEPFSRLFAIKRKLDKENTGVQMQTILDKIKYTDNLDYDT